MSNTLIRSLYICIIALFSQINVYAVPEATDLHAAVTGGNIPKIRRLIRLGNYNINGINKNGMTPLHIAASRGYLICMQELINKGAKINAVTREKWTPLYIAARIGKT